MRGQNYRANRALAATDRFMSNVYLDIGAAQLALALLQHPEHGRAMLAGLGGGSVSRSNLSDFFTFHFGERDTSTVNQSLTRWGHLLVMAYQ